MKYQDGKRTTTTYDAANQLTRYQVAAGTTTNLHDGSGNPRRTQLPVGQLTTSTCDGENRLLRAWLRIKVM